MTEAQAVTLARRITGLKIFGESRRGYSDEEIAAATVEWKSMPPRPDIPAGATRAERANAFRAYNRKRERAMAVAFSFRRALGYKALFGFTVLVGTGQTWEDAVAEVRKRYPHGGAAALSGAAATETEARDE